jgi:hypothetical protein
MGTIIAGREWESPEGALAVIDAICKAGYETAADLSEPARELLISEAADALLGSRVGLERTSRTRAAAGFEDLLRLELIIKHDDHYLITGLVDEWYRVRCALRSHLRAAAVEAQVATRMSARGPDRKDDPRNYIDDEVDFVGSKQMGDHKANSPHKGAEVIRAVLKKYGCGPTSGGMSKEGLLARAVDTLEAQCSERGPTLQAIATEGLGLLLESGDVESVDGIIRLRVATAPSGIPAGGETNCDRLASDRAACQAAVSRAEGASAYANKILPWVLGLAIAVQVCALVIVVLAAMAIVRIMG